jgi:hypothetical protein
MDVLHQCLNMRLAVPVITFGVLFLMQSVANAGEILYSNLGDEGSLYNCCGGPWPGIGGGPPPVGPNTRGFAFTPSRGGVVGQIDLPFWGAPPAVVSITLNADNGGSPGTVLDSWNISPYGLDWNTCCTLDTLIPHGAVTLTPGTQYWVVGAPDANQFTFAGFYLNDIGVVGPSAISVNGGPFVITQGETMAAFDVIDNSVPESGSFLLTTLGLAACVVGFNKRRSRPNEGR